MHNSSPMAGPKKFLNVKEKKFKCFYTHKKLFNEKNIPAVFYENDKQVMILSLHRLETPSIQVFF